MCFGSGLGELGGIGWGTQVGLRWGVCRGRVVVLGGGVGGPGVGRLGIRKHWGAKCLWVRMVSRAAVGESNRGI